MWSSHNIWTLISGVETHWLPRYLSQLSSCKSATEAGEKRWLVWGEKLSSTDGFWTNQLQCGLQTCRLIFLVTISIKQTLKIFPTLFTWSFFISPKPSNHKSLVFTVIFKWKWSLIRLKFLFQNPKLKYVSSSN